MNVQEFEISLSDLETRVDRLRALYENWFRGYEKTEPSVARKEVERRVYALRKELPRNTALRFRYHQLYQRYTTLATYWQRTARQIEEGTYRLQLQRIRRRREDEVVRTHVPAAPESESDAPEPRSYELTLDESLDVQKLLDEADLEQVGDALENGRPRAPTRAPESLGTKPVSARFGRPSLAEPGASSLRPSRSPEEQQEVVDPAAILVPASASQGATIRGPRTPGEAHHSVEPGPFPGSRPAPPPSRSAGEEGPRPPLRVPALAPPPQLSLSPPDPRALSPVLRGAPAAAPQRPAPPPPPPAALKPPAGPRPPPPPVPGRPVAPPASSGGAALGEPQLRRIYEEYSAARRRNKEGDVRFETLASSIQKMLPELRKKHQGKQIDFEVVLKDGRVGLKPKAT